MSDVAIDRTPSVAPDNITLERNGMEFTGNWKIPAAATDGNRSDRWESLNQIWHVTHDIDYRNYGSLEKYVHLGNEHHEGSTSHTTDKLTEIKRSQFYPLCGWYNRLFDVMLQVEPWNSCGTRVSGVLSYRFEKPRDPAIDDIEMSSDTTPKYTTTIYTDEGKDEKERYDTQFWVVCRDNVPGSTYNGGSYKNMVNGDAKWYNETTHTWENINGVMASTQKEIKVSITHSASRTLQPEQYIELQVFALARGVMGDSGTVSKSFRYAYPKSPTIKSATVSSMEDSGVVTVLFDRMADWIDGHKIQLDRIKTTQSDFSKISEFDTNWTNVVEKDINVSGLTDSVVNAKITGGDYTVTQYVYYRIGFVSNNSYYTSHSPAFRCDALTRAGVTGEDDTVFIDSVSPGKDGESLFVILGWNNQNQGNTLNDADGTEVSWAEHEDSWRSNDTINTHDVPNDWKDDTPRPSSQTGVSYDNTAAFTIRSISDASKYYVRARRYKDPPDQTEGDRTFGAYAFPLSTQYPISPSYAPENVTLHAPAAVIRGQDISVYWTFAGSSEQSKWTLYRMPSKASVVKSAEDSSGMAVIPASEIADNATSVSFLVSISTGGEWVDSNTVEIQIKDAPTAEIVVPSTLEAQPAAIMMKAATGNLDALITITSLGMASIGPGNKVDQLAGDVVWTDKLTPDWVLGSDGEYVASVLSPVGLLLHDGGRYSMKVVVIDRDNGLQSEPYQAEFAVDYEHKALPPLHTSKCDCDIDHKMVTVTPLAPEAVLETDLCDVYRWTPDSVDLLVENVPFGTKVRDRYAPFSKNGGLKYRVVTKTVDGDTEWVDVPYNVRGHQIRFDWGDGRHLEVQYNLGMDDSYKKGFTVAPYLDGSRIGDWDASVERKGSFSTQMVRLTTREEIDLVRELAQYAGPVYVRQPNGCAFAANVDVSKISEHYDSLVLDVSFDVERLDAVEEFLANPEDIEYVEEPEEAATILRSVPVVWGEDAPEEGDTYPVTGIVPGYEFDHISGWKLMTALDGYAGWGGFKTQAVIEYDENENVFELTSLSEAAETYLETAAAITGNQFIMVIDYVLTEVPPNE